MLNHSCQRCMEMYCYIQSGVNVINIIEIMLLLSYLRKRKPSLTKIWLSLNPVFCGSFIKTWPSLAPKSGQPVSEETLSWISAFCLSGHVGEKTWLFEHQSVGLCQSMVFWFHWHRIDSEARVYTSLSEEHAHSRTTQSILEGFPTLAALSSDRPQQTASQTGRLLLFSDANHISPHKKATVSKSKMWLT